MVTVRKLAKRIAIFSALETPTLIVDFNKIKLLKLLKTYKYILQIVGIIPYTGTDRVLRYGQIVHCFSVTVLIWTVCLVEIMSINIALTTLEKGLYFCELFFYAILITTIYLNGYLKANELKTIVDKLTKLYQLLEICYLKLNKSPQIKSGNGNIYKHLRKEVVILSICIHFYEIVCVGVSIVYRPLEGWWLLRSFVAYNLPNILINLNLCIYWLALRFTALLYSWANGILENLSQTPSDKTVNHSRTSVWFQKEFYANSLHTNALRRIHDVFLSLSQFNADISDVLTNLVDIFRIILVLNFLTSFLVLTIEFFALYKYFDDPSLNELTLVIFKTIWLTLHGGRIFFILITNNAVTKQVSCNYTKKLLKGSQKKYR